MISDDTLLEVSLQVNYPNKLRALRDVSFNIHRGEVLGLVGESGSGKSTIALALLNLLRWKHGVATGRILFCGRNILSASEQEMRSIRGRQVGLVSQSPLASLNPALRIGTQLGEAWRAHAKGNRLERNGAVARSPSRVGLPNEEEFPAPLPLADQRRTSAESPYRHRGDALTAPAHCRRAHQCAGCGDAGGSPDHAGQLES